MIYTRARMRGFINEGKKRKPDSGEDPVRIFSVEGRQYLVDVDVDRYTIYNNHDDSYLSIEN